MQKKVCLVHGNEILKLSNKSRIFNALNKSDLIIYNSQFTKNKTFKNFKNLKWISKLDEPKNELKVIEEAFKTIGNDKKRKIFNNTLSIYVYFFK